MKSAILKDTFREIKRSFGRFISIFAIIALGCGFFSGIKATMPDMIDSAYKYFDEQSLMDLRLMSNIGIRSENVSAVRKAENVSAAIPGYSKDVFYRYNNQNCVLKVMSVPNEMKGSMNTVVLLEGRLPEKSGECVVEVKLSSPSTFRIGNELTLTSPYEDQSINEIFRTDTFKIVGIVTSPMYIGYQRDATNIGNGEVLSYMMVREEDFSLDYYSELFVRFDGLEGLDPFSDEYKEKVSELKAPAVEAFKNSVDQRYDEMKAAAEEKLRRGREQLDSFRTYIELPAEKLGEELEANEKKLAEAQKRYDGLANKQGIQAMLLRSQILKGEEQMEKLRRLAEAEKAGDSSVKEEYLKEIERNETALAESEAELAEGFEIKYYENDRFSWTDYASFKGDAEKIDAIAKVFPAFFLLIVALVTLTTMTRMIDEQRTQIGTYKALGYSVGRIMSKYLIYAFIAAIAGSVIGTVIGLQIFPSIIYDSYKIMYNIPEIITPFRPLYMILCMAAALVCTGSAVAYASLRTLRSAPSQLMRPRPPAKGRRVLLERVGFIWSRLSFLMKVTVRNLLRYKKRFFMTVAGVAGCTALIITGFGLKHSIKAIIDKQFGEVCHYDATVLTNAADNKAAYAAMDTLRGYSNVKSAGIFSQITTEAKANGQMQSVSLVIPEDSELFSEYVELENVDGSGIAEIAGSSAVLTEKLALLLDVSAGDKIKISPVGLEDREITVGAVVKNYALHYIYIPKSYYSELYGSEPVYKTAFVKFSDGADSIAFKEDLIKDEQFLGVSLSSDSGRNFLNSVDSLDKIVILLIVCAGMLAVIVLYNLSNINITERVRELATIKVLGFFDGETSAYIYRENIISSLIGILLGLGVGKILHYFVVITSEVDIVMFDRGLVWWAMVIGVALTMVFAALVNVALHFKLKRIDMVESLKSVE